MKLKLPMHGRTHRRGGSDPVPFPGLPYCLAGKDPGVASLTAGSFVHPGMGSVFTNDRKIFTHLPVTNAWNIGATQNIDGSVVILRRGIYRIVAHVTWDNLGPANAQSAGIMICSMRLNDVDPPGVSGGDNWAGQFNVGSHNSINSFALGSNIDGDSQWAEIDLVLGSGFSFMPYVIKPRISLGSGSDVGVSGCSMSITQLAPIGVGGAGYASVEDEGIDPDWQDKSQ